MASYDKICAINCSPSIAFEIYKTSKLTKLWKYSNFSHDLEGYVKNFVSHVLGQRVAGVQNKENGLVKDKSYKTRKKKQMF